MKIFFTLKELRTGSNSFRVKELMLTDIPRVGNPGLKLANTFGVKPLPRVFFARPTGKKNSA